MLLNINNTGNNIYFCLDANPKLYIPADSIIQPNKKNKTIILPLSFNETNHLKTLKRILHNHLKNSINKKRSSKDANNCNNEWASKKSGRNR